MPLEIEKKFLVTSDAWRTSVTRSLTMQQAYLTRDAGKASVRVRIEDDHANLNIKAAVVGSARAEYEYPIPLTDARELLATVCVGRIDKIRHHVPAGDGLIWEIDEFSGDNAGLIVAEIELQSADQDFVRPAWLGRELTAERRWYNQHLALHPYNSWPVAERQ